MKKYNYILLSLAVLLFMACNGEKKTEAETEIKNDDSLVQVTQEQFNTMHMEVAPLVQREFDITTKASGKIDVPPQKRVKVTSFVGGFVKSTSLLVGDKVTKGQALLTLESSEYLDVQQSYFEIAEQMKYLQSEYQRQKTLFEEKIASQKKYLEAESEYKRARATYQSLRQKLLLLNINPNQVEQGKLVSVITIYAPMSGDITVVNVNAGSAVLPTDVIMEIIDTNALHLELSVFEKDIFNLKKGQQIKFSIPQVSTDEFESKVSLIGKSVEGSDRIINLYGTLDGETKKKLLVGMFVDAQIISDSKMALGVPFDALVTEEGNNFLLVLISKDAKEMKFRKTLVKVGERNGEWIEIIVDDKIKTNSEILIKGVYDLI